MADDIDWQAVFGALEQGIAESARAPKGTNEGHDTVHVPRVAAQVAYNEHQQTARSTQTAAHTPSPWPSASLLPDYQAVAVSSSESASHAAVPTAPASSRKWEPFAWSVPPPPPQRATTSAPFDTDRVTSTTQQSRPQALRHSAQESDEDFFARLARSYGTANPAIPSTTTMPEAEHAAALWLATSSSSAVIDALSLAVPPGLFHQQEQNTPCPVVLRTQSAAILSRTRPQSLQESPRPHSTSSARGWSSSSSPWPDVLTHSPDDLLPAAIDSNPTQAEDSSRLVASTSSVESTQMTGSEDAEDKRLRNTQASRFRAKKKRHVQNVERNIRELEERQVELAQDVDDLRRENGLLKGMVDLKYGRPQE